MKIKVGAMMEAVMVLTAMINSNRAMSQKGKYRVARMHSKLQPEFVVVDKQRNDMITAYGHQVEVADQEGNMVKTDQYSVPPDKLDEFARAWGEITDQEIDVEVSPIPLALIDLGDDRDGSISSAEIIALGDLIVE